LGVPFDEEAGTSAGSSGGSDSGSSCSPELWFVLDKLSDRQSRLSSSDLARPDSGLSWLELAEDAMLESPISEVMIPSRKRVCLTALPPVPARAIPRTTNA
jgi:hypothetical protein